MYQITLSKQRYHEVPDMLTWCKQHIGNGGWQYSPEGLYDAKWSFEQTFGNTTFRFIDARDYSRFVVKWEWTNNDRP